MSGRARMSQSYATPDWRSAACTSPKHARFFSNSAKPAAMHRCSDEERLAAGRREEVRRTGKSVILQRFEIPGESY